MKNPGLSWDKKKSTANTIEKSITLKYLLDNNSFWVIFSIFYTTFHVDTNLLNWLYIDLSHCIHNWTNKCAYLYYDYCSIAAFQLICHNIDYHGLDDNSLIQYVGKSYKNCKKLLNFV